MMILEQQQLCKCRDARIVLTMPPRITMFDRSGAWRHAPWHLLFCYGHERRRRFYLYAIAALEGPAKAICSTVLNPACLVQFSKSESV